MDKIKVLVIPSDTFGVGKYRSIDPHVQLENNYPDEFSIEINEAPNFDDMDSFSKYDIIHIHKAPANLYKDGVEIIQKLKEQGCKVIVDNDDYWHLGAYHPSNGLYINDKLHIDITNIIKEADLATATTPLLEGEVKKFNKNTAVLPNAVDPNERQFKPNPEESDFVRFGWLGGSTHKYDLGLINQIYPNGVDNVKFLLCGYDIRGTKVVKQPDGSYQKRNIKPEESVWYDYEKRLTNNYSVVSDAYKEDLLKFNKNSTFEPVGERYERIWTKPINRYATGYNKFDVLLAPLKEGMFNKMKSQLKLIEAGFHKKAVIVQDYGPYQLDTVNAYNRGEFNPEGNAILIDSKRNHKDWTKAIKFLAQNPDKIEIIANNLYETVSKKYDLNIVTEKRREIYKNLISK